MRRWLKLVLPAWWWVGLALAFYLVVWGLDLWVRLLPAHAVAARHPSASAARLVRFYWHVLWMPPHDATLRRWALDFWMIHYGLFRALGFHPLAKSDYREWFAATPWRPGKELPCGPVQLVRQDLVLVSVTSYLLLAALDPWPIDPALFFLAAYVCGGALLLRLQRSATAGWLLAGAGLAVLSWPNRPAVLVILGALSAACGRALRGSLEEIVGIGAPTRSEPDPKLVSKVGLSLAAMSPGAAKPRVGRLAARLGAIGLLTWWYFVLIRAAEDSAGDVWEIAEFLGGFVILWAVLARLVRYLEGHGSPLGLAARFAVRRLVVPSFDVVFVTPLVMLTLGFGLPHLLRGVVGDGLAWSVAVLATLACGVLGGPDWQRWRLTAEHTVRVDGTTGGGLQIELTPRTS